MTQKYKKTIPPQSKTAFFSSFPDVLQPDLSDFPDVSQPDLSGFPDVLQPNLSNFPDVFWFRFKGLCQNLKNNLPEKILFLCEIWFTFVKHICESARFEKAPPLPLCTYILLRKRFASIFLKQKSPNF